MILVTTAGKVGAEAARLLAEEGRAVRLLARTPESHTTLAAMGVDIAKGDLDERSSIDRALRGVTSVLLVSPAVPAQELTVVAAAATAGVEHVVKITSDASVDSPIGRRRDHHRIETGLRESGLAFSLLRSNAYMQNLLMLAPAIAANSSFATAAGQGRIGMVDARDVAAVAAHIAAAPSEHHGRTYWLSGSEALSYADAAAHLSSLLGRSISYRSLSASEQLSFMIAAGVPPAAAQANTAALELFSRGDGDWVTDDLPRILGRPPRTFGEFATDHASSFSPPPPSQ